MHACFTTDSDAAIVPLLPLNESQLEQWLKLQPAPIQRWVTINDYLAKPGSICKISNNEGGLQLILVGVKDADDFWSIGGLPSQLPPGVYSFASDHAWSQLQLQRGCLAWGLGSYRFEAYIEKKGHPVRLLLPKEISTELLIDWLDSAYLTRDLINMGPNDLGPAELAQAVINVGDEFNASTTSIKGIKLVKNNFPAIYEVGKGSDREPILVDLHWGDKSAPKLTLVGKGVCFDSGGLNIKPAGGMRQMKTDMGGAAHALALARMIMARQLPVQLRLLIPAVENSVGGNSYRPGDVIQTRAGKTVEIGNTDAEGRLVLCDALALAVEDEPDCLIDFATLTGAARVALGPDLAALFCNNEAMANGLLESAKHTHDDMWRMPLYQGYRSYLESPLADLCNMSNVPGKAGAITAALFLESFVPSHIHWAHFDIFAANMTSRPGRPVGGEMQTLRAVFAYLEQRYCQ